MASKAITKETRSLVSKGKSAVRKRMKDKALLSSVAYAVGAPLGAVSGAAVDASTKKGELKAGPVPITPVAGVIVGGIGLAVGGMAGAGGLGLGVGWIDQYLGRKTYDAVRKAKAKKADEDEDADEE